VWNKIELKAMSTAAVFILLAIATYISGLRTVLFLICGLVVFAIPGIVLMLRIARETASLYCRADILIIGTVIGIGVSSTLTTLIGYFLGFNAPYLFLGLSLFSLFLMKILRVNIFDRLSLNTSDIINRNILSVFFILIASALVIPYASFGRITAKGLAFTELQETDLLGHMVTAIELSKGIPPQNPYFSGETLHYYWLAHVFPAFVLSFSGHTVQAKDVTLLTSLLYSLLFVGTLFVMIKRFYTDRLILITLMVLALFAYSYNDLFVLARWLVTILPDGTLLKEKIWQRFFIDEWGQQYTGYSHGWFRSFLVEPHTTLALTVIQSMVIISKDHGLFPQRLLTAFIQGALLSCSFAMDSFVGLLAILSYGIFGLYQMVYSRSKLKALSRLMVVGLVVLIMLSFMVVLEMIKLGHKSLVFEPYTTMLVLSPIYFLIDYGPTAVLGAIGVMLIVKQRKLFDEDMLFFLVLGGVSVLFMFFVRYPDVGTQVFRKGANVLRIPLIIFSGVALREMARRKWKIASLWGLLLLAMIVALPTLFTDVQQISTFGKENERTHYLKQQDYDAYVWIRDNLPSAAVIQDLPSDISSIPTFAERRTALGNWVHAGNYQIPTAKVQERHDDVYRGLFLGTDINKAANVIRKYGIRYIYIGTAAAEILDNQAMRKFDGHGEIFEKIYSQGRVAIYKVKSNDSPSSSEAKSQS
jgi:hypothetical protein